MEWKPVELKERLYYLDALRAFLLCFVVILHAGEFWDSLLRVVIGMVTVGFFMPLFYTVSGFFTAYSFNKSSGWQSYSKRFYFLLMPAAILIPAVHPLANYLLILSAGYNIDFIDFMRDGAPENIKPPLGVSWHMHFWFVIVLAIFTALYFPMEKVVRSDVFKTCLQWLFLPRINAATSFFLCAVVFGLAAVVFRGIYYIALEGHFYGGPFNHILVTSFQYLPFFILGLAMFFYEPIFKMFHTFHPFQFVLSMGAIIYLYQTHDLFAAKYGENIVEFVYRGTILVGAIYALNALCVGFYKLFKRPNDYTNAFTDASYSIYIFHLYIMVGFFYIFYNASHAQPLVYFSSIVGTFVASFAVHKLLVKPFPLMRLLFNGDLRAKRRVSE